MDLWHHKNNRWPLWPWLLVALLGATDAAWIAFTSVELAPNSFLHICTLIAASIFFAFSADRCRENGLLYTLGMGLSFALIAWPALRLFNHLTMTLPFPWVDNLLSHADKVLGLDWRAYIIWLNDHPWFFSAIDWTYAGLDRYSAAFFIMVSLSGDRREKCFEFLALFIVSACLCMAIGTFFPAKAAMLHYAPDLSQFRYLNPTMGTYHIEHMEALRTQTAPVLKITALPGLVTFPSFHTAMGLLLIYVCRANPWLFGISVPVNVSMIATTPLLGGHYFIDLIGGTFMALVSIAIVRALSGADRNPCAVDYAAQPSLQAQLLKI